MTELQKALIIPLALVILIPASILLYFAENIKGYYRFKWYCENEGGLKVYEKLEKNVGWIAEDKSGARTASTFKGVPFVRYKEIKSNKRLFDIKYIGGNETSNSSFVSSEILSEKKIKYMWKNESQKIKNELRLKKITYEVVDINSKKNLLEINIFYYSIFDRNKTLLNAPSVVNCYSLSNFIEKIESNF
jgi:hypothetical protein